MDGASTIRWLKPDGSVGTALQFVAKSGRWTAFSVSDDDSRIAIATLDYSQPPQVGLHLTVQDLPTGNAVDIFDSKSSTSEWPVGWHGSDLVMAIAGAGPVPMFAGVENPYGASEGYHVVDSTTAVRLVTLGFSGPHVTEPDCSSGPLVPAGTPCATTSSIGSEGWDGRYKSFGPTPFTSSDVGLRWPVLSPDGLRLAWETGLVQSDPLTVLDFGGSPRVTAIPGQPLGWLDDHYVVSLRYAHQKGTYIIANVDSGDLADTGLPVDFRYYGYLAGLNR